MSKIGQCLRPGAVLGLAGCLLMAVCFLPPAATDAHAADSGSLNEDLVVRYALDDTATASGNTLAATKWDKGTQAFVPAAEWNATVQNNVNGNDAGVVTSVKGQVETALSFTGKAHARADFHLPADATGMTISLWVKNITTYWGSLIEFWDGSDGGRLGKGTMQGNGGRSNEGNPWSANCAAHTDATMASGAGWDSFFIEGGTYNNNNGGAAVDNMKADTWYQVTYTVTSTEMRAYRNGVLKQTFSDKYQTPEILQSIMRAAKNQTRGKLGIRLGHDSTGDRADVLDELRIYNGAMSAEEVREIYFEYDPAARMAADIPEYYPAEGLSYPEAILLGGATEVTDADGGQKTGTTADGVIYTYTPIKEVATPARDEQGITIDLKKGESTAQKVMKFARDLKLKATLGYKIGESGENVVIPTPETADDDIIVKLPANTDLSEIRAGNIAAQKLAGDDADANYETEFTYIPSSQTALVRVGYRLYPGQDTFYTIRFVKKSTATFAAMRIDGGLGEFTLTPEDFAENSVNIFVADPADFELNVNLTLAEGATAAGAKTQYTEADLVSGKIAIAVTNENGDTVTYDLVPVAAPSSDASLTALTAQGFELSPAFAPEQTAYSVTVGKGEGTALLAALTATPAAGATVQKVYNVAEGKIILTVTAADGTVRRYTVTVVERDADATLKELKAGGETVEGFDPAVLAYTVKYKGDAPEITATANSAGASVLVGEADEDGKVTVTVTAASGAQTQYTVTLVKMSSAAELVKLTLNGTEVAFTDGAATYALPFGMSLETLSVSAQVSEGASAAVSVGREESKITVTVTAEDGTVAVYTVTVTAASAPTFADGVTEDNSPKAGGCGAALTGVEAAAMILIAGVGLLLCRKRRTH